MKRPSFKLLISCLAALVTVVASVVLLCQRHAPSTAIRELRRDALELRDGALFAKGESKPFDGVLFEKFAATTLYLALDAATDVLRVRTELLNTGDALLDVQWVAAATLPLPDVCTQVRSYAGQHLVEFLLQVDPLTRSTWRRENRRGRTSHDCFPGAVVSTPGATQDQGLVFGAHLAWSGNHQQSIEWLHDGSYQWQLGEWLAPGEVRLAPGESLSTPEVVAALSTEGLNGLAASFHAELRRRMSRPGAAMSPRPVHLNTWEALYFDHQLPDLLALADAAADVGVERFVLDDGWFQGRNDDRAALGDWWADPRKYPHGLGPLAAHVLSRGMQFGLWFEPEMVNPDSETRTSN